MPIPPPVNYEAFITKVHNEYEDLSRTFKTVGRYVTQNPNDVAIRSINAIADQCGVHASSLVRFAQHFGYSGFKQLQGIFHKRLATAAPGFEARVGALKAELELHEQEGARGFLGDLVARDIASLRELLGAITEADLNRAVDLMIGADVIYLAGQLRSAPIVTFVRYVLTMLRRRTILLDASGGLATEMVRTMGPHDLLFAVSFRFYAKEVVNIVEAAAKERVPIVAISDSRLSPLAKSATVLFPIPEDEYAFSRSLAAPMCLAQALMVAMAARLQPMSAGTPRIPVATQPS